MEVIVLGKGDGWIDSYSLSRQAAYSLYSYGYRDNIKKFCGREYEFLPSSYVRKFIIDYNILYWKHSRIHPLVIRVVKELRNKTLIEKNVNIQIATIPDMSYSEWEIEYLLGKGESIVSLDGNVLW